jgi:hypothetical protein
LLNDAESKFLTILCAELVKLVRKVDESVMHLTTADPWATEKTEIRRMAGEMQKNLELLRDRSVGPLVSMSNHFVDHRDSPTPGNNIQQAIQGMHRDIQSLQKPARLGKLLSTAWWGLDVILLCRVWLLWKPES